jgi:hypothetical protein
VRLGHAERDLRIDDLPLRADQTLRDGRLSLKERVRDLRGRESRDRAQRERDLRFARERGVTTGEDELEALVGE